MNRRPLKVIMSELSFRKKIAIVILCMAVIRLGSVIPLPFVNAGYMQALLGDGLGFFNAITGGSYYQMSIFALSISPYITSSIIVQLLCVVIPGMEEMRKDGKSGQDKLRRITIIMAVTLAFIQSFAMAAGLGMSGLLVPYNLFTVIGASLIWALGAAALIAIGEFISLMNIGNGISFILVTNILASLPSDISSLYYVFLRSDVPAYNILKGVMIFAVFALIICACVILSTTKKKIRITNSRKLAGEADSTFPIPLNTCSVMPVIFASSILTMPIVISRFFSVMQTGIVGECLKYINTSYWFLPSSPKYSLGALIYIALTTFFTYFYLGIGFNAIEIADNFKKSGIVIPGIRPGAPTADYIERISTRIALLGNTLTTLLILFMYLICNASGLGTLSIAGTSVIICVSVIIEEKALIESVVKVKSYGTGRGLFARATARSKS